MFPDREKADRPKEILPLSGLAWVALLYTWFLGAFSGVQLVRLLNPVGFLDGVSPVSLCLFKSLTHWPCVFCGLTRSFILIGQGQFTESLQYHLLGLPVYLLVCGFAFLGPFFPLSIRVFQRVISRKLPVLLLCVMLTLCWLWKIGQPSRFW